MVEGRPSYEQLVAENAELRALVAVQAEQIAERDGQIARLIDRVEELERRLGSNSSNSSQPPSGDAPWDKQRAKPRSGRSRSGRKPGKQPGEPGTSRRLSDEPDRVEVVDPARCGGCQASLVDAPIDRIERRQVVEIGPPPPPQVIEYRRIRRVCGGCGACPAPVSATWPTGDDQQRVVSGPGSPVRMGARVWATAVLLTVGHFLPISRATGLLNQLTSIGVSTGWMAGVRTRAARLLESVFVPHMQRLLASVQVLHVDETTGRADQHLRYVHIACTRYLTLLHTGGRSAEDIDAGGVLPAFDGTLVRDGYAGYAHLSKAMHAWCGAHLLRDLRRISDTDPDGQIWAIAMADVLIDAHTAAQTARASGNHVLDPNVLGDLTDRYTAAISKGRTDNHGARTSLAADARTLLTRFDTYPDMILRFATDLTVPFTNNEAERGLRPVKVQQRTSGGTWRTLQGLTDFATVHSYLDTATKWGIDKLHALHQLFTTGPWLPTTATPAE